MALSCSPDAGVPFVSRRQLQAGESDGVAHFDTIKRSTVRAAAPLLSLCDESGRDGDGDGIPDASHAAETCVTSALDEKRELFASGAALFFPPLSPKTATNRMCRFLSCSAGNMQMRRPIGTLRRL